MNIKSAKGFIVYNRFLDNPRIQEQVSLFACAAEQKGLRLLPTFGDALHYCMNGGFHSDEMPNFALFYDKDLPLARAMEAMGVRVFNSADAIALCDDKALMHITLCKHGCPVPKTIVAPKSYEPIGYTDLRFADAIAQELGLPFVAKYCVGSQGEQVSLVRNIQQLRDTLSGACGRGMLFQQYIDRPGDIRVIVIGDQAVAAAQRFHPETDFRTNVALGGNVRTYQPTDREARLAVASALAMGLDFAGVDLIAGPDGPLVLEVNSNPQTMGVQACTGIDVSAAIIDHILLRLFSHNSR